MFVSIGLATHDGGYTLIEAVKVQFADIIHLIDHMKYMSNEEKLLKGIEHFQQSPWTLKCENC